MGVYTDTAVEAGMRLARRFFQKRGNHSEAHLSEKELAGLMALAFNMGAETADKVIHDATEEVA